MRLSILKTASYLLLIIMSITAQLALAAPLISPAELQQKLGQSNLVVIDFQPAQYFQQAHIPGAVNTDYAKWRSTNTDGLREMRPSDAQLNALIGGLGIDSNSDVVISPVGNGPGDMTAAARIYWTLYTAGLENLSILNGGLISYYKAYGQAGIAQGPESTEAKTFEVKTRFTEIMRIEKAARFIDMEFSIVDARSVEEYRGLVAGSPKERPGALPTAVNLPFDSMMNTSGTAIADADTLKQRFEAAKAPLEGPQMIYCHTGHRAALVWFVAHEILGNEQARLYDGSTLEWSSTPDYPLETRLDSATGS